MGVRNGRHADRLMLWIDAVGGYWVCLGNEVVLGQPEGSGAVDVPILGDLSRRHACIRRDGEEYLIEALHEVRIDDRPVCDVGRLCDGSRIQLGASVRLLFRRPHALSGTARLDFASRHRTHPSADAVLLMADTCVLGPKRHCHVVCRDWKQEAVLYRCRTRFILPNRGAVYHRRRCVPRPRTDDEELASARRRFFVQPRCGRTIDAASALC